LPSATVRASHPGQKIISAIHNKYGEVSNLLANKDEKEVSVGPGEKIEIKFISDCNLIIFNIYEYV